MRRIPTCRFDHPWRARIAALGGLGSCLLAAALGAAAAPAQAAVPRAGTWESGGVVNPRVTFDVVGPARSRVVHRVSFPIVCKSPGTSWASSDTSARIHADGRFTGAALNSVIRGRFTGRDRAIVTVRTDESADCKSTTHYVVLHRHVFPVRNGRFLSLVSGGVTVGMETSAFGRMVDVEYVDGTVPGTCSDGSQRPLKLEVPIGFVLGAPIRPSGRFDMSVTAAGTRIAISGTFSGGAVAAYLDFSVVLPGGTRCKTPSQPLIGSLFFPMPTSGEGENVASYP
jgi:hypothetical protein